MKTSLRYYIKPSRIVAPPVRPLAVSRIKNSAYAVAVNGVSVVVLDLPIIFQEPARDGTFEGVRGRGHVVQTGGWIGGRALDPRQPLYDTI